MENSYITFKDFVVHWTTVLSGTESALTTCVLTLTWWRDKTDTKSHKRDSKLIFLLKKYGCLFVSIFVCMCMFMYMRTQHSLHLSWTSWLRARFKGASVYTCTLLENNTNPKGKNPSGLLVNPSGLLSVHRFVQNPFYLFATDIGQWRMLLFWGKFRRIWIFGRIRSDLIKFDEFIRRICFSIEEN